MPSPGRRLGAALALAAALLAAPPAAADDFVDRANQLYAGVGQAKRSDLVMMPLLAAMNEPPAELQADELTPLLVLPGMTDWAALEAWALAPEQAAVIAALGKVTEDENPQTRMVFALPYGVEATPVEMVQAELYVELGDPPTLSAAEFLYLPRLKWVFALAHVEANRRAGAGDMPGAMDVLIDSIGFARQIADREFMAEKLVGMGAMYTGINHLRDVANRDLGAETRGLSAEQVREMLRRLDPKRAALSLDRILLPKGDRIATEQLLHRVYVPRSGPNPETFAATLARISVEDRPLRLFAEAARWERVQDQAAGWFEVMEALNRVYDDWVKRWSLSPHDPLLNTSSDFQKIVVGQLKYAPLAQVLGDTDKLFRARRMLEVEASGTRMAFGVYGYFLQHRVFPPALTSIRPSFVSAVENDPFDHSRRTLRYFVPIRDTPEGEHGDLRPHEMRVFPPKPYAPFSLSFREPTQFILYSRGPDGDDSFARDVTQSEEGGDYLLWPPLVSLLRKNLVDQGQLN
ncbi:MAG TPA: hypothetical protein VD963_10075 [Phycisphaerales bacterium]|nr:hypothetical protein [Phycisphaerales bacterium]